MEFEALKQVIVDTLNCDPEKVTLAATLSEDLEADSLDAVELNMAIEDEWGKEAKFHNRNFSIQIGYNF